MNKKINTFKDINSMNSLIAGIDFCDLDEDFSKVLVDKNGYDINDFMLGQKIGKNNKYKSKKYIKKGKRK